MKDELKVLNQFSAHDNIISAMILLHQEQDFLITASQDGTIAIYTLPNFKLHVRIPFGDYVMSLAPTRQNGFYAGFANGFLLTFNSSFDCVFKIKLHQDCISQIMVYENNIITVSYDGYVIFSNESFEPLSQIYVDKAITGAKIFKDILYILSQQKTQVVSLVSKQMTQMKYAFCKLYIINEELFGVSATHGLTKIKQKQNIKMPISCIFSLGQTIYGLDGNIIFKVNTQQSIVWSCWKFKEISFGLDCTSLLQVKNSVILAFSDGSITILSSKV